MEAAIAIIVYPAYQKLIAYFQALLPKSTTDDGVWKLPDGAAYYAYMLRQNTTTTMPPEEIHEIGLREVARIEGRNAHPARCQRLRRSAGRRRHGALGKDPRFHFPNDDKGRAAAIARIHAPDR